MTAKPNDEGSGWTPNVRNVVVFSVAILAMPIIGEQVGELLQIWPLLELIEAVPAVVCALFVSRLPRPAKAAMHIGVQLREVLEFCESSCVDDVTKVAGNHGALPI